MSKNNYPVAGFALNYFVVLIFILLNVILSLSAITIKNKQTIQSDQEQLQANYYALGGLHLCQTAIPLPANHLSNLTLKTLLPLPGYLVQLNHGGLKLVQNDNTYYSVGYQGSTLDQATAIKVFSYQNGISNLWPE